MLNSAQGNGTVHRNPPSLCVICLGLELVDPPPRLVNLLSPLLLVLILCLQWTQLFVHVRNGFTGNFQAILARLIMLSLNTMSGSISSKPTLGTRLQSMNLHLQF